MEHEDLLNASKEMLAKDTQEELAASLTKKLSISSKSPAALGLQKLSKIPKSAAFYHNIIPILEQI